MSFSLIHFFYAVTVVVAAFAATGPLGFAASLGVLAFWTCVVRADDRWRALGKASLVASFVCHTLVALFLGFDGSPGFGTARATALSLPIWVGIFWLYPRSVGPSFLALLATCLVLLLTLFPEAPRHPPQASWQMTCNNNVKTLALALQNYHDTYGVFPPAAITDKQGRPLHSWRVLILPFLEQGALYGAYRFDEPWNGPHNSQLSRRMPACYRCPFRRKNTDETSYLAVVDPSTVWPPGHVCRIGDITDGTSGTISVVEADRTVPWMMPTDLTFNEAVATLDPRKRSPHYYEATYLGVDRGRTAAFVDGSTRSIPQSLNSWDWRSLLTRSGGEAFEFHKANWPPTTSGHLILAVRWIVFGLLVLMPLPWCWRNRQGAVR